MMAAAWIVSGIVLICVECLFPSELRYLMTGIAAVTVGIFSLWGLLTGTFGPLCIIGLVAFIRPLRQMLGV